MTLAIVLFGLLLSACIIIKYFWNDDEFEREHSEAVGFRKDRRGDDAEEGED